MNFQTRSHIAFFLLLISLVHVLPVKLLHECKESAENQENHLESTVKGTETLTTLHLECNLCEFQLPPFTQLASDFSTLTDAFPFRQGITAVDPPALFSPAILNLRGPPTA